MAQMNGLTLQLYHHPVYPIAEALPRSKRLARTMMKTYRGHAITVFEPSAPLMELERDRGFEAGESFIELVHPELGMPGFWNVHVKQFVDAGWAVQHVLASIMPYDKGGMIDSWAFMMEFAPQLVVVDDPTFALLGGISDSPDPRALDAKELPPLQTWNWFSKRLVDKERLGMLKELGFYAIEPVGKGYVVQVVPDVYTKPSKEVLAATKAKGLTYKVPNPPKG